MKNTLVYYDDDLNLRTEIEEVPLPEYGDDEILIMVVVAGSNPKDWKHPLPDYFNVRVNQGDDVGGVVMGVGKNAKGFHNKDRVAGFHVMDTPRGTFAEYAVCPSQTVFHIPDDVSFEEAATIPLAAYTAAVGLFRNLRLPLPFERADKHGNDAKIPLIVNGASSAVGAFAVKLARLSPNIRPIIGTAGGSSAYAKDVGCDAVVDYRSHTVADDLKGALGGQKCHHVFDASNSIASVQYLTDAMESGGRYTCTLGLAAGRYGKGEMKEMLDAKGVWNEQIWVGSVHDDTPPGGKLFGGVMSRIFETALKEGTFSGHPYKIVRKGLEGLLDGLKELRDRKGGNEKMLYRIADTPGL